MLGVRGAETILVNIPTSYMNWPTPGGYIINPQGYTTIHYRNQNGSSTNTNVYVKFIAKDGTVTARYGGATAYTERIMDISGDWLYIIIYNTGTGQSESPKIYFS